jgi:hypothetical protein
LGRVHQRRRSEEEIIYIALLEICKTRSEPGFGLVQKELLKQGSRVTAGDTPGAEVQVTVQTDARVTRVYAILQDVQTPRERRLVTSRTALDVTAGFRLQVSGPRFADASHGGKVVYAGE